MVKLPVAGDRSDSYSADIDFIHRIALIQNIHINMAFHSVELLS